MEGNITGISIFQIGHVSQDVVWVSTWTGNKGKYRTSSCAYREKGDSKLGMMQVEFTVSSSRCFIWLMILWHSCWKDEGPRGRWFPLVTSTWFQNQFTKKSRTSWDGIWVAKNISAGMPFQRSEKAVPSYRRTVVLCALHWLSIQIKGKILLYLWALPMVAQVICCLVRMLSICRVLRFPNVICGDIYPATKKIGTFQLSSIFQGLLPFKK